METIPTARFRALVTELGAEPGTHFEALSPRGLWAFLAGYATAVPSFGAVLRVVDERVAKELRTRLALDAGSLLFLTHGDTPAGYRALLQRIAKALPADEHVVEPEPVTATTFRAFVPLLAERPATLVGADDARVWACHLAGFHRGLVDRGLDPTPDRALLSGFEAWLQQQLGFVAPWPRLLHVWGPNGSSARQFVERFAEWEASRGEPPCRGPTVQLVSVADSLGDGRVRVVREES